MLKGEDRSLRVATGKDGWCLLSISDLIVWGWLLGKIDFSVLGFGEGKGREIEKREEWQSVSLCFGGRRR